ncbi:hypothetical protein NDGK_00732 [Clostridiales bacterium CHKCI001]|nr:hypothetical protein NDGK_00732 [Clostridiales bacterium CHKCI001]
MNKTGRIIGIVLMLILGITLLYFAFQPPHFLIFMHGNTWRIGSGLIGVFFILAGVMNIFHKEK